MSHEKFTKDKTSQKSTTESSTPQKKRNGPWTLDCFPVEPMPDKIRFHDFDLPDMLMHGIQEMGFRYCTDIQSSILQYTLQGKDAVGKSQTGTGKTAAFLITIAALLNDIPPPQKRYIGEPRVLIVAPTRELALQIGKDAKTLMRYMPFRIVMLIGGMDYDVQIEKINKKFCDVIIATPGRLLDFFERRIIYLDMVETLILDEADRMLDMGFIPQIRRIVHATPRRGDRQTLLFSATFNDAVLQLVQKWTWEPNLVNVQPQQTVTDTIDQRIYMVEAKDKLDILYNLITRKALKRVMVFANRRDITRTLTEQLQARGLKAGFISGDVPQKKRVSTLKKFTTGELHVLVATDVAGRGIHIDDISHVVNYNLPEEADDYIHRIGRTGRAGSHGISVSFACEDDAFLIEALETKVGQKLDITYPPQELL